MKVLITGGGGFLGSHICEYYRKRGDEVDALDNFTTYELDHYDYSARVARNYMRKFLKGIGARILYWDIRHEFPDKKYDYDFIIHTAAQPTMTLSIKNPRLDFETNVSGTLNVLELARKLDIPMINCSSIHIYGNYINQMLEEEGTHFKPPKFIDFPTREKQAILTGDISPLHASKRAAEIYVDCYKDTYGLKVANFRLTGMYGERQFAGVHHGWVSNFAIKTILKKPIAIFGSEKQVRDILYAGDAVRAFQAFYENQKSGTYNIGGGISNSISLIECLNELKRLTGIEQDITITPEKRFGDLWYFVCDISKAMKELKWKPKIHYKYGLAILVDWIMENKKLFKEVK